VPLPSPECLFDWAEFLQWLVTKYFNNLIRVLLSSFYFSLFSAPSFSSRVVPNDSFILFRMMTQSEGIPSSVPQIQSAVEILCNSGDDPLLLLFSSSTKSP